MTHNKSFKDQQPQKEVAAADAINGTRNGLIRPLLWLRQSRNLILACAA